MTDQVERVYLWQTLPWEFWLWFFLFLYCVVMAAFSSRIAAAKGFSSAHWFAAGFFFGLVGLWAAVGLPDRRWVPPSDFSGSGIVCIACGYLGRAVRESNVCPLCGGDQLIPAGSPRGRKLIEELHSEKPETP